ncbi:hybrid non-ribosomal peptide synthetase/type I polyketide synthase [Amycolatopsis azurea]|uniref:Phenyloxazoline synthase MbtB n=1 Tax=Amycolatopsis azurea DSM 43854 TaxID=1238180 RepID=M2QRP8_9PSEU|nr:hybrid non-ribosomal peptide synthetase/type I polyketide synthase [Amycolatopsis azurea]EMD29316.1 Malonyl CoA-acyl carrier protein transacylase [Amycolatopsis azurea DSM 43854]OOC08109.1 hybrid non-ribosomal peptide synthetase/type I polyketide synthase [Amycolatopsis azurea DSM 43854]
MTRPETTGADIAVVGMAGRFPGAPDLAAYWRNLHDGVESVTALTDEQLLAEGIPPEVSGRPDYVRMAPLLDGIDQFDAQFFGINPREAALLDPQQRLFLETAWHALEDAGRGPGTDSDVGVFAGANMPAYLMSNLLGGSRIVMSPAVFELQIHNDKDYLASRTSFLLGLTGPSVTVQTACSSSLVAVHQAARALRAGECATALAGGVTVRVPHQAGYLYEEGLIYSPDGHCRPFDADGRGTVFGNGVGAVVLRRLEDALADGDPILAVIKSTAVNNDGADKVGYTAPSVSGQERLITAALAAGGVDARTITALEAHGTGTPVGDPIEIKALTRAFGAHTDETGFCAIGSVKANIGHLESAAGIASLIKAILQLRNRLLVPDPHFRRPNPRIDFDDTPFFVNTALTDWKNGDHPRRIGVSSFGIGGTNAHAVLEEAPAAPPSPAPRRTSQVIVLSARSPAALEQSSAQLAAHLRAGLDAGTPADLADVAATTQLGRGASRFRRALVASGTEDAAALLEGADPARVAGSAAPSAPPKIVFLFPGQGTQYPGMGADLYRGEPVYRAAVDECAAILDPLLGTGLLAALYPPADADPDEAARRLADTSLAQPALFTTEYALAKQLAAWGVVPDAMVGHSLGEFVAATLAGVVDLPDVLRLVAARGRMMRELPAGGMLSVAADEADVLPVLPANLSVAAVNAPGLCVVSGPHDALDALSKQLAGQGVSTRPLHTSHAFHSAMIDPIVAPFTELVGDAELRAPRLPFVSTVTGTWIDDEQATDPEYWGTHMRRPVRFGEAVGVAAKIGRCVLLEVGPGNTLGTLARQAVDPVASVVTTLRRPDQDRSDTETLLAGFSGLWLAGADVDWTRLEAPRQRSSLPGYPFQHKRYWVEPRGEAGAELVVDTPAAPETDETETSSRPEHLLTAYTAPRNDLERSVATLWEEFFGFSPIGVHDNFFELGGHSLLATQMLNRLRGRLHRVATPAQLLAAPNVAALTELLAAQDPDTTPAEELPSIVPAPDRRHEPFPLTEMQQAQWIGRLGSFDMGGVAPHLYLEFDSGTLDLDRLERAWQQVVRRHEMLRIVVLADGRQRILADVPDYRFEVLDLRESDEETATARLAEVSGRMSADVRPADTWPLWEVRVSRLRDGKLRTHIGFDLLCADVASFFYQVLPAWREFYADPASSSAPPELSFRDYVLAEEALQKTALYERSLDYWRDRVKRLPAAPELPTAVTPGELTRPEFVRRHANLDADVWARIKEQAGEHGVTPSSVLVAAYAAVISRWSKSQHFTLNFTAVNRLPLHHDVDATVGEFASFELLEVDTRSLDTFGDLVTQIQRQAWEDFEHRYVSGVRILRELNRVRRDTAGGVMPVVFTSALSTEKDPASVPSPVDWLGEQARFISQTPQVTIDHFVLEFGGVLQLAWHAVDELFPDDMMAEMFEAYQGLLATLTTQEGWRRPPTVPLPEWQLALRQRVNDTAGDVPAGSLAARLLAVGAEPALSSRPAVITPGKTVSHGELSGRAVHLARTLAARGLGRGSVVGVGLAKGWQQIVAVAGVSAAGATYVPIDPELPDSRREWLIEAAGVDCVVVDGGAAWPSEVDTVLFDDLAFDDQEDQDVAGWTCPAREDDIAYVIYTSGSTGTPKGVAETHTAAVNTLVDVVERFGITAEDRVLGLSSLSFDLSVFDVFGVLGAGGALVLPEPGARRDPSRWLELVREHGVSVWNSVPALFEMLVTHLEGDGTPLPLRLAMLSGDWIPVRLPDRARALAPDLTVMSLGGATEAAIWSIHYPVEAVPADWTSIPYGYPLRNQTFHVLNDRLEPAPVWTAGQLYIGGIGVAACYWNDEQRTAESFFVHPATGERLYRTGDLGRYLPDGAIEFLGREDFQVKIGGFRVELGEVEHALALHPEVTAAVATALGSRTQQRLVAYLVPAEPGTDETALLDSVRAHLSRTVPGYLIPADLIVLDKLPLSGNGKVDRAALPAPERTGHAAAATEVEAGLQEILGRLLTLAGEVLSLDDAGPEDNFFELGGDSIMGIQLVSRADAEGLRLRPQDLFESTTFLELARRAATVATAVTDADAVPLTAAQTTLVEANAVSWVSVETSLDAGRAGQALREVAARHTTLRLRLGALDDGTPGLLDALTGPEVAEIDLSGLPAVTRPGALAEIVTELAGEIDLAAAVPAKLVHVTTGDERDRLIWVGSAAVLDDASWRVLLADLAHAATGLAERGGVEWESRPQCFLDWSRNHAPAAAAPTGAGSVPLDGELVTVLGADTVRAFREAVFASHHLDFGEALTAALALALREWPGDSPSLTVDRSFRDFALDGSAGRYVESRTLSAPGGDLDDLLADVKRGYREAAGTVSEGPHVHLREVVDHDWSPAAGPLFLGTFAGPSTGHAAAGTLAEVGSALIGGELRLSWRHSGSPEGIAAVAEAFAAAVDSLTAHCTGAGAGRYETSDFPLADLGSGELAAFLSTLESDLER